jgi:DNA-binding CsgD family transcriptional regulator/tetratricopeptide (TPR) repeat protein
MHSVPSQGLSATPWIAGSAAPDWPLVGRAGELAAIDALVQRAQAGVGGCLVVSATAGAGKTFLLDGAQRAATVAVRRAAAVGGTVPPYSLVTAAFGRPAQWTASGRHRSFLEAGIGNAADTLAVDRLLVHVDELLADGPVLALLDDAHLADTGSASFVAALLPRLASLPLALVLATRPPQTGSSLAEVWPHLAAHAPVLDLAPLLPAELAVLCSARFGAPPGPRLQATLAATGGVPLLAATTLEAIADEAVHVSDGCAEIDATADAELRSVVPDPVRSRVLSVVGDDGVTAAAAALAGATFDVADVAAVVQAPLRDVVAVVSRLDGAGVVVAEQTGYRFRHDQLRAAAAALVSAPIRVALHRGFATLLADRGESPLLIADHLVASQATGDSAAGWLTEAASVLVSQDPTSALALADRATSIATHPDRALAVVRLRALSSIGRVEESDVLARALLADVAARPEAVQEEITLRRELALGLFQLGRPAESIQEIRRAEALVADPRVRWRLVAERAFMHLLAGDFVVAREVAREAAEAADAMGDLTTRLAADMAGSLVTLYLMGLDEADQMAQRLVRLADLPEAAEATFYQPWFAASIVRLELGDFAEARRINGIGRSRSGAAGYAWIVPGYDTLDAAAHFQEGNLDDTEAAARAAVAAGVADSFGANLWCHALLARCAGFRGEWALAARHADRAMAEVRAGQAQFGRDHLAMALSAVAEQRGDLAGAFETARDYWEAFSLFGIDSPRQELSLHVVRLGLAVGDGPQVERVVDHLAAVAERNATSNGDRFAADHAYAVALAAGDRAGQTAALDRLAALGFRLRLLTAGVASAVTPAATEPVPHGLGRLSKSERAVVQLVGEGLTNSDIANRLVISRRTVESHVSAAYRKLGVGNRVELARRALGQR